MLEFENVSYSVAGKTILKDVNVKIEDRFVAITGPNGSGKSTMAKLIAGIIKPTSGKILFDGILFVKQIMRNLVKRFKNVSMWI